MEILRVEAALAKMDHFRKLVKFRFSSQATWKLFVKTSLEICVSFKSTQIRQSHLPPAFITQPSLQEEGKKGADLSILTPSAQE
jgi:hypothetical protein